MDIDLHGYVVRTLKGMSRTERYAVAARANVGKSTMDKIVYGYVTNPRSGTVQSLADVLLNHRHAA